MRSNWRARSPECNGEGQYEVKVKSQLTLRNQGASHILKDKMAADPLPDKALIYYGKIRGVRRSQDMAFAFGVRLANSWRRAFPRRIEFRRRQSNQDAF